MWDASAAPAMKTILVGAARMIPRWAKQDNPNPRLRKADIRTGQRWHLNDSGDGDTEYSLHRNWPDM